MEGRYATALYTAAMKKNMLQTVLNEVDKIKNVIIGSSILTQFINSPLIDKGKKEQIILEMLQKEKYSDMVTRYFQIMTQNNRLPICVKSIEAFQEIVKAAKNETNVTITSSRVRKFFIVIIVVFYYRIFQKILERKLKK